MKQMALLLLQVILIALTGCVPKATPNSAPTATMTLPTATPTFRGPPPIIITPEPGTRDPDPVFNLHITVTDEDYQPVKATIRLDWPDTGGNLTIGPTADQVLPIPVDGAPFLLTVEAAGYHAAKQPFQVALSRDLDYYLVIRLAPIEVEPPRAS